MIASGIGDKWLAIGNPTSHSVSSDETQHVKVTCPIRRISLRLAT